MTKIGRGWSESEFTRWFCDKLEKVNAKTVAFVGSMMQASGIPDRYVCHRRFRGWLEMKKDDKKVLTSQRIFLEDMFERGDTCFVIRYRASDVFSIEDIDGTELGFYDLKPLLVMTDQDCALTILRALGVAKRRQDEHR